MKALLLENIHPEATRLLTERGIEVENRKGALDEAELVEAVRDVQLLGIRSKTHVTRAALDAVLAAESRGRWPAYRALAPSTTQG